MKIEIELPALKTLVNKLIGAVERKNTIPSLANIALITDGDILTGKATDLDIEVTAQAPATITQQGSTTVSAAMLAAIVAKMPAGALVSITLDDKGELTVKAGKSRYVLQTLPIEDFPRMASSEYQHQFTMQSHDLARLFNLSKGAMSTEETRYYLQGVYLHPTPDNDLCSVSTDGHRLYKVTTPAHVDFPGVIVPRKTVAELVKTLDIGDVVVSVSDTKIKFDMGAVTIVSKVIDGTFPDYTRVIPAANNNHITANSAELKQAADRVATVADDRARAVKIEVADGIAKLTTRGNGANLAEDEVAVSYGGPALDWGVNSKYFAEILNQCSGQDVTLECGNTGDPILVRPCDDKNAVYVVMPMRV